MTPQWLQWMADNVDASNPDDAVALRQAQHAHAVALMAADALAAAGLPESAGVLRDALDPRRVLAKALTGLALCESRSDP